MHAFARGDAALAAVDGGEVEPQILVTDVVMPHMNGKELSLELQRRKPQLPVLFISGYADDILADHGIVGADVSLMTKPITAAAVLMLADDVGIGDVGAFGGRTIKTPHLDRIAADFERGLRHHGLGPADQRGDVVPVGQTDLHLIGPGRA